ncbi:MAG: ATP-binding protein, partial [Candidatus Entotheonellia bacterium]
AHLLFQVCSSLYERVAMIVTTHVRFADWTQVFGDERLTGALLDRLTYRAHIVEFVGESFRFRQRLRREAQKPTG